MGVVVASRHFQTMGLRKDLVQVQFCLSVAAGPRGSFQLWAPYGFQAAAGIMKGKQVGREYFPVGVLSLSRLEPPGKTRQGLLIVLVSVAL